MAGPHLSEIELLELDDRGPGAAGAAHPHLDGCAACREALAEIGRAGALLRGARRFDLAPGRLEEIVRALPAREREPRRSRAVGRRALLLAGAAAVAAVAVGLALGLRSGPGGTVTQAGATAQPLQAEQAPADATAGAAAAESAAAPLSVAGPVEEVVSILQAAGLTVRVDGQRVTVEGATLREIEGALAGRAPGPVEVAPAP